MRMSDRSLICGRTVFMPKEPCAASLDSVCWEERVGVADELGISENVPKRYVPNKITPANATCARIVQRPAHAPATFTNVINALTI